MSSSKSSSMYLIIFFLFSIFIAMFLAFQVQKENYIPLYGECRDMILEDEICKSSEGTKFVIKSNRDGVGFSISINDENQGFIEPGKSVTANLGIEDKYTIKPEISGYYCRNNKIEVFYEDLETC